MRHACNQSTFFRGTEGHVTCTVYCMNGKTGKTAMCVKCERTEAGGRGNSLCAQDCRSLVAIVWDEESRTTVEL